MLMEGRVGMYGIPIHNELTLLAFVVYGWQGADDNPDAAARTNALLEVVLTEMQNLPVGPVPLMAHRPSAAASREWRLVP